MNWLTNYIKPKLESLVKKKDIPKSFETDLDSKNEKIEKTSTEIPEKKDSQEKPN